MVTSRARNKIRSFLRSEQRQRSHKLGQELVDAELGRAGLSVDKITKSGDVQLLIKTAKEANWDDVLISIGYGRLNAQELVQKVFPNAVRGSGDQVDDQLKTGSMVLPEAQGDLGKKIRRSSHGILVSGIQDVLVHFAKCCSPLPGEEIVGFITRGRGVTIHRSGCRRALDVDPRRRVDVQWVAGEPADAKHTAFISVVCQDKPGVLAEVTSAISSCGANIQKANITVNQDMRGVLDFELAIKSLSQLQGLMRKVEGLPAVVSVERSDFLRSTMGAGGRK